MIRMRLSSAARAIGARHEGVEAEFHGVGIDSRRIAPGALFVALPGARADGHDFVAGAKERGACAALVSRPGPFPLPVIRVPDSAAALRGLARTWRSRCRPRVVAVTGSNGKTTVKEMLAAILREEGRTLATRGNLNNELGLPLTLLELDPSHEALVVELGANRPGEIARLAALSRPSVGVITQCAPAHLEGFGSVEGVARAKAELFRSMALDTVAVVNAEDSFAALCSARAAPRRVLTFGLHDGAEIRGAWRPATGGGRLAVQGGGVRTEILLRLAGRHNAMNALAASAAAFAAGCAWESVRAGLAGVRPVPGRLEPRVLRPGVLLIDDTYNANPASLRAALEVLSAHEGRRWLVLGDMGELGPEGARLHAEVADGARRAGVERLYTTGCLSRATSRRFGRGAAHFESREALVAALVRDFPSSVTVLVKGSRAMRMEGVVRALAGGR